MSFKEEWSNHVPPDFVDASLDDWDSETQKILSGWLSSLYEDESRKLRGNNLIIAGPVGAGKTHLAFSLMRHLWFEGSPESDPKPRWTWFMPVSQLLIDLRGHKEDECRRAVEAGSLLFLDDLGSTRMTEWGLEQVYWMSNIRRNNKAPVIVTSNIAMDSLEKIFGEPIYSRLINGHHQIRLSGEDRRK